jgi:hypothetical protein
VELFVVVDKAFLGRGVFGVFSSIERAEAFAEDFHKEKNWPCNVRQYSVIGYEENGDTVFAAHIYDDLHDTFVLDGIYAEAIFAFDAVGRKGLVIKFKVDNPDEQEIVRDS